MSWAQELVLQNTALGNLIGSFLPWQHFSTLEPVQNFLHALPGEIAAPLIINLAREDDPAKPREPSPKAPSTSEEWIAYLTSLPPRPIPNLVIRLNLCHSVSLLISALSLCHTEFLRKHRLHRFSISASFYSFADLTFALQVNLPPQVSLMARLVCPISENDWESLTASLAKEHTSMHSLQARGSWLFESFEKQAEVLRRAGMYRLCLNDFLIRMDAFLPSLMLLRGSTLVELDLSFNYIESCAGLRDALKDNVRLKSLFLNDNLIGRDNPCESLIEIMTLRGALEEIHVGNNGLSSEVVLNLLVAFCMNPRFLKLGLGAMDYSETEVAQLRMMLAARVNVDRKTTIDLYKTPATVMRRGFLEAKAKERMNLPLEQYNLSERVPVDVHYDGIR